MELISAYSDPVNNKHCLQIEVNRKLYMNEITRKKISNYKRLKKDLHKLINEIKINLVNGTL